MKVKAIKAAVVGCGNISDIYIQNMQQKFQILEVVGCAASHMESATRKAEQFGIEAMTIEEICESDEIELVVNLTPPSAHYAVIKQLIEAGKHVYTEKVFAVELAEAKELSELADKKGVYLGVAPDTFLGSSIQTARQLVESGLIGEVTSCTAIVNRDYATLTELFSFLKGKGAGIGFDLGIYYVTALLSILGPVKKVNGMMKNSITERIHPFPREDNFNERYQIENEGILAGTILFENGVIGSLQFNSESVFPEKPYVTLYGTQGVIYMSDPNEFGGEVRLLRKGQTEAIVFPGNFGYSDNSRGLGAAEMAWAIQNQRRPRANKEMAYHALELLHGIAKSNLTERTIILQSTFEKMPPLPQGYLNREYLQADEEAALTI